MCGIVAVINKYSNGFTTKQVDTFTTLLWLDTLRGEDSTGVFMVNTIGNVDIVKSTDIAQDFISTDEYSKLTKDAVREGFALVGHNRKATRGTVKDENAHPFWVDDKLVLVHNGSFIGDHKHIKDTEVDSHAMAHHLAEGHEDIESAFGKLNAAIATIWWDFRSKTLNMFRNEQRPLHFMETDDGWYFASEWQMLDFVAARNSLSLKGKAVNVLQFLPYNLHGFPLKDKRLGELSCLDMPNSKYVYKASEVATVQPPFRRSHSYHHRSEDLGDIDEWEAYCNSGNPQQQETKVSPGNVLQLPSPSPLINSSNAKEYDVLNDREALELSFRVIDENTRRFSYVDWINAEKGVYVKDTKVKATVLDTMEKGPDCFFICKVHDMNQVRAVVKVPKLMLEAITSPGSEDPLVEFYIDKVLWKKLPEQDHLKNFQDSLGVVSLIGRNTAILNDGREEISC